MSELVLCEVRDKIATVTINRPEALNALNIQLLESLEHTMAKLDVDPEVRVVIITGAGEKSFVAGADIAAMQKMTPAEAVAFSELGQRVFTGIENSGKFVIAAVNGYALGGGFELALACDMRVGSEKCRMGIPETGLGVIPGFGGTQRLPRVAGLAVAKEMMATAKQVKAPEALALGLVSYVVPPEELMSFCRELAAKVIATSGSAVALGKRAMNQGMEMDLGKALAGEAALFGLCFATADQREGMDAFVERRKAQF